MVSVYRKDVQSTKAKQSINLISSSSASFSSTKIEKNNQVIEEKI